MLLLVKDSPQGKKCLPPAEKSAYREEKKLLTTQRKKSLPYGEKTAYRVVVNLPYHPQPNGKPIGDLREKQFAVIDTVTMNYELITVPEYILKDLYEDGDHPIEDWLDQENAGFVI